MFQDAAHREKHLHVQVQMQRLRAAIAKGGEGEAPPWTPELMEQLSREADEMKRRGETPDPDVCPLVDRCSQTGGQTGCAIHPALHRRTVGNGTAGRLPGRSLMLEPILTRERPGFRSPSLPHTNGRLHQCSPRSRYGGSLPSAGRTRISPVTTPSTRPRAICTTARWCGLGRRIT